LPKAFHSAYGFGADATTGGRGGTVVAITNTNASGAGSPKEALEANYDRIIVPRVGGVVTLTEDIVISNPNFSYFGQCAPGGGLLFKDYNVEVNTNNGIIRYLRSFPGPDALGGGRKTNGIMIFGPNPKYNIVLDHSTAGWSTDQNLDAYGHCYDTTIQWCVSCEGRSSGGDPPSVEHGYGSLIGQGAFTQLFTISLHHNIWTCNYRRNPQVNVFPAGPGPIYGAPAILIDFRNNLIYNWVSNGYTTWQRSFSSQTSYNNWVAAAGGNPAIQVNAVGNHWIPGPDSSTSENGVMFLYPEVKMYAANNLGPNSPSTPIDGFGIGVNHLTRRWNGDTQSTLYYGSYDTTPFVQATPFSCPAINQHDATEIFDLLTAQAGANLPGPDTLWQRIMNEIITNTGSLGDHNDYPTLATGTAPTASQPDLIPNSFKTMMGLDTGTDYTGVSAPSGLDWVEVWAGWVAGDGIASEDLPGSSLTARRHREAERQLVGHRTYHFLS